MDIQEVHYREFTKAQLGLLQTAETLFAERGIKAVAEREIARAAGHKNNSAIQYHFEHRDLLDQALLDFRLLPLNALRCQLLQELDESAAIEDILSAWLLAATKQMEQFKGQSRIFNLLEQYRLLSLQSELMKNPVRLQANQLLDQKAEIALGSERYNQRWQNALLLMSAAFSGWEHAFNQCGDSAALQQQKQFMLESLIALLR